MSAFDIEDLQEAIEDLQDKLRRLEAGEELCNHHWNGSDVCWEYYCTGCDKHIGEHWDNFSIPFQADAYCLSCLETPEEKAEKLRESIAAKEVADKKKLEELLEKYPEYAPKSQGKILSEIRGMWIGDSVISFKDGEEIKCKKF